MPLTTHSFDTGEVLVSPWKSLWMCEIAIIAQIMANLLLSHLKAIERPLQSLKNEPQRACSDTADAATPRAILGGGGVLGYPDAG